MMNLGGFGVVSMVGNAMRAATLTQFIDEVVTDNCDDKLEKSAIKLTDMMKSMLVRKQCGLAPNTDFTQSLKGGNVPLVDGGQLVASITYKMLDKGQAGLAKGKTNRFKAAFVGVMRQGPMKSGGSLMFGQSAQSLFNIAEKQVAGYSVKMPGNNAIKKVPARDFRKKPTNEFKDEFLSDMSDGVASGFIKLV